jgi:hypothetical protein
MKTSTTNEGTSPEELNLKQLLEALTGQDIPFKAGIHDETLRFFDRQENNLGYSQLNELLLSLGYDRVTREFFQYLINGKTEFKLGDSIHSLSDLAEGVKRFRKIAIILFGNVKYAFKRLSTDAADFQYWLETLEPIDIVEFKQRHNPIHPIQKIPGEDTYYLGYLIQNQIKERLKQNPEDKEALTQLARQKEIIKTGKRNYEAYLASDHLDVYIATSMRKRHEFYLVNEWIEKIFSHRKLATLKLRWFDPTQAYCLDRIDKGLFEALMLKRAKCTVYFVQETDTLGKNSELASTLAQGKIVIAFVPLVSDDYAENLLKKLLPLHPEKSEQEVLLDQLKIFKPEAPWQDPEICKWLDNPSLLDRENGIVKLQNAIKERYDRRASTLTEEHPLGIQVNLETGVANGVLVVRNIDDCAELIYRAVTRTLEFSEEFDKERKNVYLRETTSGCIFRVVTADTMLTNTFWNFYPEGKIS